ncbi:Fe-S cluster assembly ATPase SufC [Bacteroidota bacterium]|nr:Fe-S cluster assembly ATPase SufC [Bacteroidota bacterium]MDC3114951.1 Fe-S cluster assembly ATPase SufC [Bacteroidota bacterium]MDC3230282.1 Fe-S cluster assembly ATPase SufC [Bacteroidota bacterium]
MLEIINLKAQIEDKTILNGVNLKVNKGEVHAIMGPNGSGKSTLSSVIAGNEDYEVSSGSITYEGDDLLEMAPEERSHRGVFLSFQYPVEIPGLSVSNFIKTAINEKRKAFGQENISAKELLQLFKEKCELLNIDKEYLSRSLNEGFSGGEKKRNEIFQMAMMEPKLSILDETDSGLDIDALKIVANGVNSLKSSSNSIILITHYQRLLNYIVPDFVHILKDGKIVMSGDKSLAHKLEKEGYSFLN